MLYRNGCDVSEQTGFRPQRCLSTVCMDQQWLCPCPGTATGLAGGNWFCLSSPSGSLFLSTGCLNAAARSAPTEACSATPTKRCTPRGREKDKIICALTEGAAEKSSFVLIWKPTIRSLQSLLFVEAIILRRRLREYRTDHVQNNLISDVDPSQNSCGQLPAPGDLQQNCQLASWPCLLETPQSSQALSPLQEPGRG